MAETTINGRHVVFREHFAARFGWDLLPAARRISNRLGELREAGETPDFMGVILDELSFDEMVTMIRGAVASWEFPGDLKAADCCEGLSPFAEMLPLATEAVSLFYKVNDRDKLAGEAGSGSTSPSEG